MEKLVIEGGVPLRGEITLSGAKNSGFKLMIATLLSEEQSQIDGFSKIGDIAITKKIIESLGGKAEEKNHQLAISTNTLSRFEIPHELGSVSRACTLFVGPLLHRFGKAVLPIPGGDKIGTRPIDRHLAGLEALGAKIKTKDGLFKVSAPQGLRGARFRFTKNTHTGTDTMLMAAAGATGKTILENAAEEPEVSDLITFLNKMGAKIRRTKKRRIEIEGTNHFIGVNHEVMPDRNEAVTFGIAALATGGNVLVRKAKSCSLSAFLRKVRQAGGNYQEEGSGLRFWRRGKLKAIKVVTRIYPGFMTDWQALWTTLMTQAEGKSMVHETIFENRFGFVPQLVAMGAKIELFNPGVSDPEKFYNFNWRDNKPEYFHAARIFGPTPLKGGKFTIADIRAGATLILAALIAKGRTELLGIEHVDRGYENLDGRLRGLGARIRRVK